MGRSHHHPIGLIHYAPQSCYRGYTLYCTDDAILIDMHGRICHRWQHKERLRYAYFLSNGHILCRTAPPRGLEGMRGLNGLGTALLELDWDGNVVWEYRHNMLHHDYERLANGHTLILQWEHMPVEMSQKIQGGIFRDDDPQQMLGDVIVDVAPDGTITNTWRAWEHLNPEEDVICPLEHRLEWSHGNSIFMTPSGDWLVSFRRIDTVALIDPDSGALHWKWGRGVLSHQHHATYLDTGNILIFDNGSHRLGPPFSQVIEVNPKSDEIVWTYRGDPPLSFFSFMVSGAERLPNGNTLICEGSHGRLFEITPRQEIVWEYINPFFVPNPRLGGNHNMMFRAHRYEPDHPALQGKDLDPARYVSLNGVYTSA